MSDMGIKPEMMPVELGYLEGDAGKGPLYPGKATPVSQAADRICNFTRSWPDPFAPDFNYANPWLTKKDNKGKKDRPAGSSRPSPNQSV